MCMYIYIRRPLYEVKDLLSFWIKNKFFATSPLEHFKMLISVKTNSNISTYNVHRENNKIYHNISKGNDKKVLTNMKQSEEEDFLLLIKS